MLVYSLPTNVCLELLGQALLLAWNYNFYASYTRYNLFNKISRFIIGVLWMHTVCFIKPSEVLDLGKVLWNGCYLTQPMYLNHKTPSRCSYKVDVLMLMFSFISLVCCRRPYIIFMLYLVKVNVQPNTIYPVYSLDRLW